MRCAFWGAEVHLDDVALRMNAYAGISSINCSVTITRSLLEGNQGSAVQAIDSNLDMDRTIVLSNETGLSLDAGVFHIRNSFIARNGFGISLYSTGNGNTVSFCTIVDNGPGGGANNLGGFDCNLQNGGTGTFANNIFVRNLPTQTSGPCSFPSSISDTNISPLRFVRPDSAPYDYHLLPGSSAIDLGSSSTVMTDFDGETRPFGAGPDIGADELH